MPPYHRPVKTLFSVSTSSAAMASKHCYFLLKPNPFLRDLHTHHSHLFSPFPSKPTSPILFSSFNKSGFCFAAHSRVQRPLKVDTPEVDESQSQSGRLTLLKMRLEGEGIQCAVLKPGESSRSLCPKCLGGDSKERSFSLYISPDWENANWHCFKAKCGWRGRTSVFGSAKTLVPGQVNKSSKSKSPRIMTEENLGLEPLCKELLVYFAERMISGETLRRNAVMQKSGDQVAIAFTYRRNGALVHCKYRDINKRFWQEKDAEKILYGLDDIKGASDIIIVEGEIDKLAMEEAGFQNCVSVPDGAPSKVNSKELPSETEDTKFQYLWNCKEYLDKASRIILATDADAPGQALAEELARRLGRERCWRVKWPKTSSERVCKDANEVLMFLGPDALRELIEQAELYPIRGLFRFSDFFDDIDQYYKCTHEYDLGVSTGWKALNHLYKNVQQKKNDNKENGQKKNKGKKEIQQKNTNGDNSQGNTQGNVELTKRKHNKDVQVPMKKRTTPHSRARGSGGREAAGARP
ncbi:hypothetical protein Scep_013488 [Stephania cephalantha]|uniref:Toprim domain-containing protein n=1 Tax=Stephania cephalantha TaxID=152367 RepID=A0AAP0PAQ2_9MAGN